MRANYVRSFYLPGHQPMPNTYKLHFQSRVPPIVNQLKYVIVGELKMKSQNTVKLALSVMK